MKRILNMSVTTVLSIGGTVTSLLLLLVLWLEVFR